MIEDMPSMFSTIKDDLISLMDKRFWIFRADLESSWPKTREVTFGEFDVCRATIFMGRMLSSVCVRSSI